MKNDSAVSTMIAFLFVLTSAAHGQTLNSIIANAGATPIELDPGATYVIENPIIHTLSADLVIHGNGATIILDSSSVVNDAI